jgi:hypothetical protein
VDVAILQADHDAYDELSRDDLPGVAVVVDGRRRLDPSRFTGVTFRSIGVPQQSGTAASAKEAISR